jgi:hypothetical protein
VSDRIYPVPIKPASPISTWAGWPDDVRETIWDWNHHDHRPLHDHRCISRLSFKRSSHVFKCPDCEQFCEAHRNGAAVFDGEWLCDDCLIARARAATVVAHV